MKYIKEHIMFIFPMLAILLGIESFLVFERMSHSYEETLKTDYAILVMADEPMDLKAFRQLDSRISSIEKIQKQAMVEEMAAGMNGVTVEDIMQSLPHFYTIQLGEYLDAEAIAKIKRKLLASEKIRKVETFGKSHDTSYNLFLFIKVVLWTFVGFMTLSSLFLVIKQMEIWQYAHRERMQVMEIFGASTMLKSGILFKRATIDALIAMIISAGLFAFLRFVWVERSGIRLLKEKASLLFAYNDLLILGGIAMLIVITSVVVVVMGNRESQL